MSKTPPKTFVISGASGLIGTALAAHFRARGDRVLRLVRGEARSEDDVSWDPMNERIDGARLENTTGVVHLAGENVGGQRWTPAFKDRILASRVKGTRTLVNAINGLKSPPTVLISASGIGYYGDGKDAWLDESSPVGDSFLAQVCQQWEGEARKVNAPVRAVQLRIGMVLSRDGGALERMVPIFRLGAGARLGSGNQFVSWIALEDVLAVVDHAVETDFAGPVNTVTEAPVTNREFTKALATALRRPALAVAPAFALRALYGEFAQELLSGQRAVPKALRSSGFSWKYPDIDDALSAILG